MPNEPTIYEEVVQAGISRRDFIRYSTILGGILGLQHWQIGGVIAALQTKSRVPVLWLEFQDCAGCSEALTRTLSPTLVNLVLNKISIEYHETLTAAAGIQAEQNKHEIMKNYGGRYVLVVEGSIPTGDAGVYCAIGGRSAVDLLKEAAANAGAIIATGNCATFGGIPKAKPNPTQAKGVWEIITDKPVVNIAGCPAIPEVFTGTLVNYLVFGSLPKLDRLNRPKTFYGQTIHDRCLRRPFYEAGKFALSFDDEGARQGYCLYKLGCKGPTTYNACAAMKWSAGLSFPIQSGHPCLGCSEPNFWDGGGFYQGQSAPLSRPTITAGAAAATAGIVIAAGTALANQAQKKKAEEASKE
jgi:hydrogenase small subunit